MAHLRHAGGLSECLFTGVDRKPSVSDLSCKKRPRRARARINPERVAVQLPTRPACEKPKTRSSCRIRIGIGATAKTPVVRHGQENEKQIRERPEYKKLLIVRAMIIEARSGDADRHYDLLI
jgi:hypothetical protein